MAIQENCVRTEPSRRSKRHRGVNAVFPRLVARGGHDAALIRASADNHRLASKLRPIEQFHGDEEGVHVHVEDGCCRLRRPLIERAMLGSKSREVRHGI